MTKKPYNRQRLTQLHEQHLHNPPAPKQVAKAEREYLSIASKLNVHVAAMAELVESQKQTAQQKRKVLEKQEKQRDEMKDELEKLEQALARAREKHAKAREKMKGELAVFEEEAAEIYEKILSLSSQTNELRESQGKAAEAVLLANGLGPVTLGGVAYDFGCYGERVYLVPRKK